jgi:Domain of unknown function (DUF4132)
MGVLNKIKQLLGSEKESKKNSENDSEILIESIFKEIKTNNINYYSLKLSELKSYQDFMKISDSEKVAFLLNCIKLKFKEYQKKNHGEYDINYILGDLINTILRSKLTIDANEISLLIKSFIKHYPNEFPIFNFWPINNLVNQIEKQFKSKKLSDVVAFELNRLKDEVNVADNSYFEKEKVKIISKIDNLLFTSKQGEITVKPFTFQGKDDFSKIGNQQIKLFSDPEKVIWYQILDLAQKSTGSKPTLKFTNASKDLLSKIDATVFKETIIDWFDFVIKSKDELPTRQYYVGSFAISTPNVDILKGLVWMSSNVNDSHLIYKLSLLAERCYRKIPNTGPASASLGNACIYSLYKSEGLDGIGQLSRLKLRIKQNNTQKLIENYLNLAAEEQGISIHEIEDLAADNFDLINGSRTWQFDDYKAEINIIGIGKTETKWIKPDGNLQKTVPTFVKEKFAEDFKELKNIGKQIETNTTSQRDRIDRMFRSDRKLTWSHFSDYYLNHGLISYLSKKIIWNFSEDNKTTAAILIDNKWQTNANEIFMPSEKSIVSLWHPSTSSVQNISDWRSFLIENKIQQPLKQAFREVYILTDAEVRTKSYSNRMAAHILKQHQFNMLAKTRGWKYSLLGCFDDGRDSGIAEINLKEFNLRAEFWINEVNAEDAYNDTGIWNYVATDQVRFINTVLNETIDLIDVPVLVLSEILRDVDLFVGVASVGNDPTWQDTGGIPAYRDYWQSYSFGDLTEIAKMRKDILTSLIPRLKINKVAEIKDKFLVIKGKLRTYKIHIGSTNILMEPNDEYLCIVQDRSTKTVTENIFLPFEGDNGLSIILSKAFLLADDDKINDSTITSQINRK